MVVNFYLLVVNLVSWRISWFYYIGEEKVIIFSIKNRDSNGH